METILAIDLGGTSLCAALVGRGGDILASAVRTHSLGEEGDPDGWWAMLVEAVAELPAAEVRAIIPTGFSSSQVLVDRAGKAVRLAKCFPRHGATAEAEELAAITRGTWLEMTPCHPLARLRWVQTHDPEAFARARHVLQPKDWLVLRLTGRTATDRVSNAWALERRGGLRALSLFRRARIDAGLVPEMFEPWQVVGPCTGLEGLAGVPVLCGAMDSWCASLGVGSGCLGDAYLISGTYDAGGVLTDVPLEAEGLATQPWGSGLFHTGGWSGGGVDCLQWLAGLLGEPDAAAVVALAGAADPDLPPLLFLPGLSGEGAPGWSAATRAGFAGLHRAHGPAELARSVLEGVAFADRDLLGGLPFERLLIGGSFAQVDSWCQIRADVLGCPVIRAGTETPGLTGAALAGWTGLGVYPTLGAAQSALAEPARTFQPDPAMASRYQRLFAVHKQMQAASRMLSEGFVGL